MNLSPVLKQRFFDSNGLPLAGGQLYSYQAGTTTPQVTYSNSTGTTNSNPVILDANGYADVWLDPTLSYKFILQDASSSVLWSIDNVSFPLGISSWNANSVYGQGSIVSDSSGAGLLYVSLISNNQNQALTNVSAWRMFAGAVRTVSSNSTLSLTDDLVRSNSTSSSLTHTLPACGSTPIGKEITIKDVGTGGNTTSVKGTGTDVIDGSSVYSSALGQYAQVRVRNNGTSWDVMSLGDNTVTTGKLAAGSVTQAKLAARATGTTVAAGGVAISGSSGTAAVSSATAFPVFNLSVTITTTGRPVFVGLIPILGDGTPATDSYVGYSSTSTVDMACQIQILRGTTIISQADHELASGIGSASSMKLRFPPGVIYTIDPTAAGTYTYSISAFITATGTASVAFNNCKLIAYEL